MHITVEHVTKPSLEEWLLTSLWIAGILELRRQIKIIWNDAVESPGENRGAKPANNGKNGHHVNS